MAKPTFLQSLLNKPTQSYTFPAPKKEYHSQKKELVRIAKAFGDARPLQDDNMRSRRSMSPAVTSSSSAGDSAAHFSSMSAAKVENPGISPDVLPVDVIHGPNFAQIREERRPLSHHAHETPRDSSRHWDSDSDSDSNSEKDIFYTPDSSPRSSLIAQSPHTVTSLFPFPASPSRRAPLIREDSVDSMTSTTATTSADVDNFDSVSLDDSCYSIFSSNSVSTRLTTPVTSDAGHHPKHSTGRSPMGLGLGLGLPEATQSDVTFTKSKQLGVSTAGPPPRRSATTGSRTRRTHSTNIDATFIDSSTDADWSKDVRWLVPPASSSGRPKTAASSSISSTPSSVSKRRAMPDAPQSSRTASVPAPSKPLRKRRSKSLIISSPRSLDYGAAQSGLQPQMHLPSASQTYTQRRSKSVSARKNKTVMSMTALVEVEEPSEINELHHALMGRDRTRTHSLLHTPSKSQLNSQPSRSRVSSTPSTPPQLPEHLPAPRSQYTTSSRTVTLPNPLPIASTSNTYGQNLPSNGTPGYTSLVLPRAAYPSSSKLKASSKLSFGFGVLGSGEVDLTKGGMAQTTMASVEVVQGIAQQSGSSFASNSAMKTKQRKTLSKSFMVPSFLRRSETLKGKEKAVDESPLAFTSWRKPPGYVGANGVVVQIWAVAIDGVDQVLVKGATPSSSSSGSTSPSSSPGKKKAGKKDGESTKKADVGFIPGRSFVGRVLECGWEVGEEIMKKNDWVVGLLDVKKCGALAEFVVVDRRRLHRVPYPRMQSNSTNFDKSSSAHALMLEELALLPLAGVPAHRAVRTFASVEAGASSAPRALVLRGHDGAGAMAVQMLARRGWRVSVHVPVPAYLPVIPGISRSYIDDESRRIEYLDHTEEMIRSWGADEVLFVRQHDDDVEGRDGAVKLMGRMMEVGEEFDGVLDTIGGKEIWDAGEALLGCNRGGEECQFTTLFGDAPDRIVPSTSDLFKVGVRSTKKHGTGSSAMSRRYSTESVVGDGRKGKIKAKVGYAWVIINQDVDWQGEDIADSLRAVIRWAAVEEGIRPAVVGDKIVPFEQTPEAFVGGLLGGGGTVVVKVAN